MRGWEVGGGDSDVVAVGFSFYLPSGVRAGGVKGVERSLTQYTNKQMNMETKQARVILFPPQSPFHIMHFLPLDSESPRHPWHQTLSHSDVCALACVGPNLAERKDRDT